jgi:hypothetical protein
MPGLLGLLESGEGFMGEVSGRGLRVVSVVILNHWHVTGRLIRVIKELSGKRNK